MNARRWVTELGAIALALVVLLAWAVRVNKSADVPLFEAPEGVVLRDLALDPGGRDDTGALPELVKVAGTTTVPPEPTSGTGVLRGAVQAPGGWVQGATVRIERLGLNDSVTTFQVGTDDTGRYEAAGLPGGRYRVRAFLPPVFAQAAPAVFFLGDGEQRTTDLQVAEFRGLQLQAAVAPNPPVVGAPANVAVLATSQVVDEDGRVQSTPVVSGLVQLTATGTWQASSVQPTAYTNGEGLAVFTLTCRTEGESSILASLQGADPTLVHQSSLQMPACVAPTPTTPEFGTPHPSTSLPERPTTSRPGSTTSTTRG